MALPVDVVGPRPRLVNVEAPPRSRSSLSSEAEVESEPLGRTRRRPSADARAESEPWGRAKRSSSSSGAEPESEPWVGRSGVRAERSSPSSGAEPESEPWVGRSVLWCLWQGLASCQHHSVKWRCSRGGAGGAVFLSGQLVERRSDGGHFGSVD